MASSRRRKRSQGAKKAVPSGPMLDGDEVRALMSELDPHDGQWSYPIFRARAEICLLSDRYFYESVMTYDLLFAVSVLNTRLLDAGLPLEGLLHLQVVLDVFPSFWAAEAGRVELPDPDETSVGRHAVVLNGIDEDGESLHFINSYGSDWGDDGTGVLSPAYLDAHLQQGLLTHWGQCGPTAVNYSPIFESGADGAALVEEWCRANPAGGGHYWLGAGSFDYRSYSRLSVGSACVVDVLEIRRDKTSREGWAHVYYPTGTEHAVLRELFVVPNARRNRVGTALEALARDAARKAGRRSMHLELDEADAYGRSRQAFEAFAMRRGYVPLDAPGVAGTRPAGVWQVPLRKSFEAH